jgi:hypothetical protein
MTKKVEKHSASVVHSVISNTGPRAKTIYPHKGDTIYDYLFSIKSPREKLSLYEKFGGRAIFGEESNRMLQSEISRRAKAEARANPVVNIRKQASGINIKVSKHVDTGDTDNSKRKKPKDDSSISGDSFQDTAVVTALQNVKFTDANDAALYYDAMGRQVRRQKRQKLHDFRDQVKDRVKNVVYDQKHQFNKEDAEKRAHIDSLKQRMQNYSNEVNYKNMERFKELKEREELLQEEQEEEMRERVALAQAVATKVPDLNLDMLRYNIDPDLMTPHTMANIPTPAVFDEPYPTETESGRRRSGPTSRNSTRSPTPTLGRHPSSPSGSVKSVSSTSSGTTRTTSVARSSATRATTSEYRPFGVEEDVYSLDQQTNLIHECSDAARRALLRRASDNSRSRPWSPQFPDHVYKKEIDRVGNLIVIETPVFSITLDEDVPATVSPHNRLDNIILEDPVATNAKEVALETARNKESLKQRYMEQRRYLEALREQFIKKVREQNLQIPPLCNCGVTDPFDDHASKCCNNCPFYKNPEAYAKQLASLLTALT